MNGNNPYAGPPGVTGAGEPETATVSLSTAQERELRTAVAGIVTQTESYLPDSYIVGSELSIGTNGPQATVAVNPPAGHPVSAGFEPDIDELEAGLTETETDEVAKGLAASAAFQVMSAINEITPTAK